MFSPYMPPHAVEECLPPRSTEWQALKDLLQLTFPSVIPIKVERNDLIWIKNDIARALREHGAAAGGENKIVPSNHTVDPDAPKSDARGSP